MYLIPIQVPIYVDGDRHFLTTEWKRDLELLRDSLEGRFGGLVVLAPSRPATSAGIAQHLEEITESADGITLVPSIDAAMRYRTFIRTGRRQWLAQLHELLPTANVVHAGLDDIFKTLAWSAFVESVAVGKPTVFVQDTDIALQQKELGATLSLGGGIKSSLYAWQYERLCMRGVAMADLALLKGERLMSRYGPAAANPQEYQAPAHRAAEVVEEQLIESRLATLSHNRRRRLVYCGRMIPRKGLDHSLRIVAAARQLGADLRYDLIGNGPQREELEHLARDLGIADHVTFHPAVTYGPALIQRLAAYDALLFTPLAEDTPRMIFDGYAAGLPLLAYDIEFTVERSADGAALLFPRGDIAAAARAIANLDDEKMQTLSRAAITAGKYHAAENWYRRRAEWTFEAVERHHAGQKKPAPAMAVLQ